MRTHLAGGSAGDTILLSVFLIARCYVLLGALVGTELSVVHPTPIGHYEGRVSLKTVVCMLKESKSKIPEVFGWRWPRPSVRRLARRLLKV
jgi:hypothetical protein